MKKNDEWDFYTFRERLKWRIGLHWWKIALALLPGTLIVILTCLFLDMRGCLLVTLMGHLFTYASLWLLHRGLYPTNRVPLLAIPFLYFAPIVLFIVEMF